ncbi:uncharacterized protein LOC111637194 isoform X2 [Centruroides sculpturatus]|uniref:uncharacterized protein LOC111637194 isoform X2 n=1 Tax=Centruroides sculpturatus TaxID=218467 RepID=UPI000C6EE4FB|nr:uncharacterized protein LOC111637194 isoform X2 [Centruroides sculpturatus]
MSESKVMESQFFNQVMKIPSVKYSWEFVKDYFEEIRKREYLSKIFDVLDVIVKEAYERMKPYVQKFGSLVFKLDGVAAVCLQSLEEYFPIILRNPSDIKTSIVSYSLDYRSILNIRCYISSVLELAVKSVERNIILTSRYLQFLMSLFLPQLPNEDQTPTTRLGRASNIFYKINLRLQHVGKDDAESKLPTPLKPEDFPTPLGKAVIVFFYVPVVLFYEFVYFMYQSWDVCNA